MKKNSFAKLFNELDSSASVKTIMYIDALNLFMRNFVVLNFINSDGNHVGGVSGFLKSIGSLSSRFNIDELYIVFDGRGSSSARKNLLHEYKSNRNVDRMRKDLFDTVDEENDSKSSQISRIIHYLKLLPIKVICIDGVEADDVISYLVQENDKLNNKSIIVSSDKDYIQLVNNNISLYDGITKKYHDRQFVMDKFGILLENHIIYKCIVGDKSDCVEGVPGIGSKTLLKLFPNLSKEVFNLEKIFVYSESNIKDNKNYAKIILNKHKIYNNFKIMSLKEPLINHNDINLINDIINDNSIRKIDYNNFIKLHNIDKLYILSDDLFKWLNNCFKKLEKK